MIQPERVQQLKDKPVRAGHYVLYWIQAAQRAEWNHALDYAIQQGNKLGQPVIALFGITDDYPEANHRHYAFMLEGLRETKQALKQRGIQLVVRHRSPEKAALQMAREASLLVTDRGYLRIQQTWRRQVAEKAPCRVVQVETDAVVPVEVTSPKEEYAAATIRSKIDRHVKRYLIPVEEIGLKHDSLGMKFDTFDIENVDAALKKLKIDRSVRPQQFFIGGTSRAKARLDDFIANKLNDYADRRNDPALDIQSNMSPYLHFGQISPLYIALRVKQAKGKSTDAKDAYLEELIVRRELSINFVHYNASDDSFDALPDWAANTLTVHRRDPREYVYSLQELEEGRTHDPYWNAAMQEMLVTGKMHNYMRMYWGKKILEWSLTPKRAFETALYLNNKYFLDGRDPNSYAGVAWCFGKHDRPWGERSIFGKVRYMNAAGLRRKFDMDTYVDKVQQLL